MNICHFISSKGLGRGEFYIDLCNELVETIDVSIIIPANSRYKDRISSRIKIIEYNSNDSRYNPFLYAELFSIFKKNKFDLVHTHFSKSTVIFFYLNKFLKTIHVATKHNPRKGKIYNKINNIISVSKDVADSIRKPSKIIYNGINKHHTSKGKNKVFTICAIGRLEKVKGFDKLIESCKNIKSNYQLNIIGDGIEYEPLKQLIKRYSLQDKVTLLGYREDIPEILANSDLQVISSISEGFSMTFLEGLQNCPMVISTNVGIMKEILDREFKVENYEFDILIEKIIENRDRYIEKFKTIKNKYLALFTIDHCAKEHIKYYQELIDKEIILSRY